MQTIFTSMYMTLGVMYLLVRCGVGAACCGDGARWLDVERVGPYVSAGEHGVSLRFDHSRPYFGVNSWREGKAGFKPEAGQGCNS